MDIFSDIMTIIANIDCSISAILIRKDELHNKKIEVDVFALELLFERLCYHHHLMNSINRKDGKEEQYGILMIDSVDSKYDNKVRLKIRTLFKSGTKYWKNRYLIEDPIFVDSSYRHLSQLVDCVAYCIRRRFRRAKVSQYDYETFDKFFSIIEPKLLRKGNKHMGYGLKIFPNDGQQT